MEKDSWFAMALALLGLGLLAAAAAAGIMSDVQEWAWPVAGVALLLIFLGVGLAAVRGKRSGER